MAGSDQRPDNELLRRLTNAFYQADIQDMHIHGVVCTESETVIRQEILNVIQTTNNRRPIIVLGGPVLEAQMLYTWFRPLQPWCRDSYSSTLHAHYLQILQF